MERPQLVIHSKSVEYRGCSSFLKNIMNSAVVNIFMYVFCLAYMQIFWREGRCLGIELQANRVFKVLVLRVVPDGFSEGLLLFCQ